MIRLRLIILLERYAQLRRQSVRQSRQSLKTYRHLRVATRLSLLSCSLFSIRVAITREVQTISGNLEATCLKKLSLDAKLALDKFTQVNQQLEKARKDVERMEREKTVLSEMLHAKKMRLEVSESLLSEMLKQLQRKFNARKDVAVQVIERRKSYSLSKWMIASAWKEELSLEIISSHSQWLHYLAATSLSPCMWSNFKSDNYEQVWS